MFIHSTLKALFRKSSKKKNTSTNTTAIQSNDMISTNSSQQERSKDGLSFHFKDGRRFQNETDVSYVLPNDFDELDRIHQQHWMFRYLLQRNFIAPVTEQLVEGITVLDSGCGPGTWTLEMADTFPKSKFYGVDCSYVFPENIKPPNIDFSIGNIAKDMPFPENHFDYIFQRLLFLGLTNDDWDNNLKELYRVTKPGGYVEFIEPNIDHVVRGGPLLEEFTKIVSKMMRSHQLVPDIGAHLKDRIEKAGFVNQKLHIFEFKMNHTDKGGELVWDDFRQAHLNLRHPLSKIYPQWEDPKVYEGYIDAIGEECKKNECLIHFYIYVAQKPAATI